MNYPDNFNLNALFPSSWGSYDNGFDDNVKLSQLLNEVNDRLIKIKSNSTVEFYPYNFNNIFKIFSLCKLEDIRVVILGQDPYYSNKTQANGIAFSVNDGVKIPRSLINIIKESQSITCNSGNLEKWVKQGVFLLNATLTVEQNKPNSHERIWNNFINHIIEIINRKNDRVIFVAWGKSALKKYKNIDRNRHIILETSHPSPLSCYKTDTPFIGSNIFAEINKLLMKNDKCIEW